MLTKELYTGYSTAPGDRVRGHLGLNDIIQAQSVVVTETAPLMSTYVTHVFKSDFGKVTMIHLFICIS